MCMYSHTYTCAPLHMSPYTNPFTLMYSFCTQPPLKLTRNCRVLFLYSPLEMSPPIWGGTALTWHVKNTYFHLHFPDSRFRVSVLVLRIQDSGYTILVSGYIIQISGYIIQVSGYRIQVSRLSFSVHFRHRWQIMECSKCRNSGFRERYLVSVRKQKQGLWKYAIE